MNQKEKNCERISTFSAEECKILSNVIECKLYLKYSFSNIHQSNVFTLT